MEWKRLPIIRNFYLNVANDKTTDPLNLKKGRLNPKLKGNRAYKFDMDITNLEKAIDQAEAEINPDRIMLISMYEDLPDLHVKSQLRTANFKVISQGWYIVDAQKNRQPDLEDLLKKSWFEKLNETFVWTEFYGHSLIYFWVKDDGEIESTNVYPRIHVVPDEGIIIPNLNNPNHRVNYRENPLFERIFLEMGDPKDLGLMKDIVRNSIIKGYAIKDWARSSEKWGDPHVILKSSSSDEKENEKKEEYLKNFGNNSYAIVDEDDDITLLERSGGGNSHKIFMDLAKFQNEENSKGVNGQVGTADAKAFVGAAEVQERLLNEYTESRLRSLMYYHTEKTFPFLIQLNNGNNAYKKLEGMRFVPVIFMEEEKKGDPKDPKDPKDPNNSGNPFL